MKENESLDEILFRHSGLEVSEMDTKQICLEGVVKVQDSWFNIKLKCPHFPELHDMRMLVQRQHRVEVLQSGHSCINSKWTINELIEQLPLMLGANTKELRSPTFLPKRQEYGLDHQHNIYTEIAALYAPCAYEMELNDSCSRIRFSKFAQNEQHYLEVALPSLQLLAHSLPDCVPWEELLQKCSTLTSLLQQFMKYLEELRPFYENFNDIDELCYVVQPALPTTKYNWRMFVLRERVFLKLTFADPFSPIASMSVHIIGATYDVSQLRRIFSEGLHDWDPELDVHKNLLRIFNLCFFPMPPSEDKQLPLQSCNICYCYRLEAGDIPVVSCDNPRCSLIFHAACLREWFNTLADSKLFLNVAFGACPLCKTKLSTSFQEILEN